MNPNSDVKEHLEKLYWKPGLWTRAYCLITTGWDPLEILQKYIEKQANQKN